LATHAPIGQEMDEALRACGLDVDGAPREPSVTVLWQADAAVPQPVAILVDAQEPLWRRRAFPEQISDPDGLPGTKRWKLTDQLWLDLVPASGSETFVSGQPAEAPGGQRALVVLADNCRGKRVQLDLRRRAFPEPYLKIPEERRMVVDVLLSRAPWEE
jgi:hypothetical protein